MTKEQRIEEIEKELALLKQEIKEENEFKFFPQEGDTYWYFSVVGTIFNFMGADNVSFVNAYKTKEEAEKARDVAVAKHKLKQIIEWKNEGWKPDWDNNEQPKYFFNIENVLKSPKNRILTDWYSLTKVQPNWLYMKDRETAQCTSRIKDN
jgi:hypothetical protein